MSEDVHDVGTATEEAGRLRDRERGVYAELYSDSAFLDAVSNYDGAASTAEVAESVGCSRPTAYKRLCALEAEAHLTRRTVGSSLLWVAPVD